MKRLCHDRPVLFRMGKMATASAHRPGVSDKSGPRYRCRVWLANMQRPGDKEDSMLYQLSDVWHIELQMPSRFLH